MPASGTRRALPDPQHSRPMGPPPQPAFRTRREVDRYFGGRTIKCLICGRRFGRLAYHLAAKHNLTTDDYKGRFGLPWTRGLTSSPSHANSGWTKARRLEASKLARTSRFFELAHRGQRRREPAPFLKAEVMQHLGDLAIGFGKQFDSRVWALHRKGLTDGAIARILNVNRTTVNRRTKVWRKRTRRRRRSEV